MHDNQRSKPFIAPRIAEEWMLRIDQAAGERAPIKLLTNLQIWRCLPKSGMKVAKNDAHVPAGFGGDFFHDEPLQVHDVLVSVAEQDIAHADRGMPGPANRGVNQIL